MTDERPQQLDYASPSRRKVKRRVVMAVAALALLAGGWKYGPGAWDHARLLYYQGKCLEYGGAADEVVYEDDGRTVIRSRYSADLAKYNGVRSPPGAKQGALLFMHEMRTAEGERRLVTVEASLRMGIFSAPRIEYERSAMKLADLYSQRRGNTLVTTSCSSERPSLDDGKVYPLKIFAGQIDPQDPSHFTIRFEIGGMQGVLDGWLESDGHIRLEERDPVRPWRK